MLRAIFLMLRPVTTSRMRVSFIMGHIVAVSKNAKAGEQNEAAGLCVYCFRIGAGNNNLAGSS